jgi:RNA polymerase sigma factor (TIGR02999 family)
MQVNGDPLAALLQSWGEGDSEAASEAIPLVYNDLRRLARSYLRRERDEQTLQTTALVHEAYLRMQLQRTPGWHDRDDFFSTAGALMRRILVDHARMRHAGKRCCELADCPLEAAFPADHRNADSIDALNDALMDLGRRDPQKARIVELRFFLGLSMEEIAEALGVSVRTVHREWTFAKAWLQKYVTN